MTAQTILPANSVTGGFNVDNSLRFQSNDYLKIDPAGDGNLTTWTSSFWVKRAGAMGGGNIMWDAGTNGGNNYSPFFFQSNGTLRFYEVVGGTLQSFNFITNRVFLDPTAWYHFVYRVDTTQGTNTNRVRLYINGVQETSFSTAAYPAEDYNTLKNDATFEMIIGSASDNKGNDMQGYMSEFVHIDGQSLAPTSFGEFDSGSGIWKPKSVSGLTFGTNGFYLQFKGTGTSQNSSGIGADTSGQDNHMAVSGLAAVDQSIDTCTNNFAVMNPLTAVDTSNFSEGNLKINLDTNDDSVISTFAVSNGKWYWEAKRTVQGGRGYDGIVSFDVPQMGGNAARDGSTVYAYTAHNGTMNVQGGTANSNTKGSALSDGDIICYAFDADNGQLWATISADIDISGTANATGLSTSQSYFYFFEDSGSGTTTIEVNFGSPTFAISSGNADGNGFGNFEYAVPSGYFALNTKNLAEYG
jgi:hypothetical protein